MAEAEDGAAALFQRFNRLFGTVDHAVPPAVLLAVNHVRPLLDRRDAGNGNGDTGGFFILFAVDHGCGQGILRFLPRAERGGIVLSRVLFIADGALRRGEGIADAQSAFPARRDSHIDIIPQAGIFRGKSDLHFRQGGSAAQERQEQRQQEKDSERLSHSMTSGQKSSYYIKEKQ